MSSIALLYDDDAFREQLAPVPGRPPDGPMGLMGRQVAGKAFLDAYLSHGNWSELVALVRRRSSAESLKALCRDHPSSRARQRRLRIVEEGRFHDDFLAGPAARQLYLPCPLDPRYAWARQHGAPGAFALSGVTHTLCSLDAVQHLMQLVTAPFEPYDMLICTSSAVERMVRAATDVYCADLRERFGGEPRIQARLATIPLGVDTDRFHPPTDAERREARGRLGVAEDEVVILFVGRLSHHAKAHPFPLYVGAAEAARKSGRPIHLIFAGWAANQAVLEAFRDGAKRFAGGARVSFVDGTAQENRTGVWHAADVFASPSDNIQETFGLSVIEAMSCGLPVVATDWDGYRDLVADGETGLLVPTMTVRDASATTTSRLLMGELNYDYFLAECSQGVAVDLDAMGSALARLASDPDLRREFGAAGRRRAVARFTWAGVVRAYESLWDEQERERQARAPFARRGGRGPTCYPAPDVTFAGYPTRMLDSDDRLTVAPDAVARWEQYRAIPLLNHAGGRRSDDVVVIPAMLNLVASAGSRTLGEIDRFLNAHEVPYGPGRAVVAWLLKYGVMKVVEEKSGQG